MDSLEVFNNLYAKKYAMVYTISYFYVPMMSSMIKYLPIAAQVNCFEVTSGLDLICTLSEAAQKKTMVVHRDVLRCCLIGCGGLH